MKHYESDKNNLVILSSTNNKVYIYDNKYLKDNNYYSHWKNEFYSEIEGIESFITTVLNFNLGNIQWIEYENVIVNEEYK
jgi:hypothetical protein